MAEQDDGREPLPPSLPPGETQQSKPFSSMFCSTSYSNSWDSWDGACASQLSPIVPVSNKPLPASDGLLDAEQKLDRKAEQHSPPLHSCQQPNTDSEAELPSPLTVSKQLKTVGAGLCNMGNTCFLNATLQCITHTVPLLLKLRSAGHSSYCAYNKYGFCSLCALREHVNESIRNAGSFIKPERFTLNLSKISPDFVLGQQEDAHEFLRCLLENLHRCSREPQSEGKSSSFDEDSIVKQVFGGRLRSQLSCCECGHCSETFEPFLDLSLEIDQVDNLSDALLSFTKAEKIGDAENKLTCANCNAQVIKEKQLKVDKSPDVIALQLKRFIALDRSIEKIDKHVVYPTELDLSPFHCEPNNEVQLKYDLYGVIDHYGLPDYGHYKCTIRSSPETWHLMNDSQVTSITERDALNQEAYVLFYVRQGLSPWFSSLLQAEEALHLKKDNDASPVSVIENTERERLASSGEASSSSSRDRPENDCSSPCTASFLPDDEAERYPPCDGADPTLGRASTPPHHKRSYSDNCSNDVFDFELFDADEETPLIPQVETKPKREKAKVSSALKAAKDPRVDKDAARLLRGMHASRRKGLLDCLLTQREKKRKRKSPQSEPVSKKKRKLGGVPVLHK